MPPEDGLVPESLPAAERRVLELLALLTGQRFPTRADLTEVVVRRARRQRDVRATILAGAGVLAAVVAGIAGLMPSGEGEDHRS